MEGAGWQMGGPDGVGDGSTMASYLEFLQDDLLGAAAASVAGGGLLDHGTLEAGLMADGGPQQRLQRKRSKREVAPVDTGDDGSCDDDLDGSDEGDDEPRGGRAGGGGKKKSAAAAQHKAHREKARREKINDRFAELAKLIDPANEPKTDKLSILMEAIRFVQQTQLENSQLRQLNKFLEEKVGHLEKERGQAMYQMYQFSAMQPAAAAAGGMMAGPAGSFMMPGLGMQAAPHMAPLMQQGPQPLMSQAAAAAAGVMSGLQPQQLMQVARSGDLQEQLQQPAAAGAQQEQQQAQQGGEDVKHEQQQPGLAQQQNQQQQLVAAGAKQEQQQQQQQAPQAGASTSSLIGQPTLVLGRQQQALPMMPAQQQQMMACKPMMAPAAAQGMALPYWPSMMPQSMLDSTQDSLLRPPAA